MMTVSPAALLGSKFKQAWVWGWSVLITEHRTVTYQSVHHQHCPRLIIMLALGDNIPQLALGSIARTNLDQIQVRTEVS